MQEVLRYLRIIKVREIYITVMRNYFFAKPLDMRGFASLHPRNAHSSVLSGQSHLCFCSTYHFLFVALYCL
jgi:hypothetical protein